MTSTQLERATLPEALAKAAPRIATLLGSQDDAKRIIAIVRTEVARNPTLADCEPYSVVQSVCDAVAIGLIPGSLRGEAYLVPFKGKCQCIPGYRGYVKLAHQSDLLDKIEAWNVYQGDRFEVHYGTDPRIEHTPDFGARRSDDEIIFTYAVATLKTGAKQFVVMTRDEVLKRRAVSRGASRDDSPWKAWFPEQCLKTAVRALAKLLPLGDNFRAAEELDTRADIGSISSPLPHESVDDVQEHVMQETKARAANLRQRLSPDEEAEARRQEAMDRD